MNVLSQRVSQQLIWLVLLFAAATAAADLQRDVRRAVTASDLQDATIAISVSNPADDKTLVSINDTQPMIPASNLKILTSGAALHVLGDSFNFQTRLLWDDATKRLTVIGDGDPGFGDPELLALLQIGEKTGVKLEAFLDLWVQPLIDEGIEHVDSIVVDDRIFDREFVHDSWPQNQLNRWYCAEVSGLNFHLNILHFFPRPIRNGSPDITNFEPYAPWIDLTRNSAKSRPQQGNTFSINRPLLSNDLTFYGNVRSVMQKPVEITVHDMPTFFARILKDRLEHAGVAVDDARAATSDDPEPIGRVIAPIVRTPISTAITRCNRDSYNLYADALLKRAGTALASRTQPGSFSNGAAAVQIVASERLTDRSLTRPMVIADGSGMSRENRVTATLLTSWLNSFARDETLGPVFMESLAVGGQSGTLRKRFKEAEFARVIVRAKSGYINGVSCLSGYVLVPVDGGQPMVRTFSVLVNDLPGSTYAAKRLQERVVQLVADSMLTRRTVEVGNN